MKQTKDLLISLEINGKVIHLKESEVPSFLKLFIKYTNPFLFQNTTQTLQQPDNSSFSMAKAQNTTTLSNTLILNIKGKTKVPDFTKVLKKTFYTAAIPFNNIKKTNQEKISILNRFFVFNKLYARTKVSHYKGKYVLLVFFDTQESAMQI